MLELRIVLKEWCFNGALVHLSVFSWCSDISAWIWTG